MSRLCGGGAGRAPRVLCRLLAGAQVAYSGAFRSLILV